MFRRDGGRESPGGRVLRGAVELARGEEAPRPPCANPGAKREFRNRCARSVRDDQRAYLTEACSRSAPNAACARSAAPGHGGRPASGSGAGTGETGGRRRGGRNGASPESSEGLSFLIFGVLGRCCCCSDRGAGQFGAPPGDGGENAGLRDLKGTEERRGVDRLVGIRNRSKAQNICVGR